VGKKLDDLNLKPEPIASAKPVDPRDQEWYRFAHEIDELLAGGQCDYASRTLEDIKATVEKTQRVSDGQRRAVQNIEAGGNRTRSSRRYEGFDRRFK
jgi:hypothetical protein